MHKVLFIGLGTMGFHMAGHLSKSHDVIVYNRTTSKSHEWMNKYNGGFIEKLSEIKDCLLYTSPSPRDATLSRMPSSA